MNILKLMLPLTMLKQWGGIESKTWHTSKTQNKKLERNKIAQLKCRNKMYANKTEYNAIYEFCFLCASYPCPYCSHTNCWGVEHIASYPQSIYFIFFLLLLLICKTACQNRNVFIKNSRFTISWHMQPCHYADLRSFVGSATFWKLLILNVSCVCTSVIDCGKFHTVVIKVRVMGEGEILGTMLSRGLAVWRLSHPLKVLLCYVLILRLPLLFQP